MLLLVLILLLVVILIAVIALHVFAHVDSGRWWRDAYMIEQPVHRTNPPGPARGGTLAPWLVASVGIAVLSFITGLFGPLGGVGDPNRYVTILLFVSLSLSFLWLIVVVVASIILRRRVFWLLIGAPAALCWPAIFVLVLVAISACHPGCLPAD
jgi:hypothetical protein